MSEETRRSERRYVGLFWLHVKKSAGLSTRALLGDAYRQVDRTRRPATFIQSDKADWNDILNNYRVVLGNYQFRRALFAKKYLYPADWDRRFSFAFSREPVSRAVSMFRYLFWRGESIRTLLVDNLTIVKATKKFALTTPRAFDLFLDVLEQRFSDANQSNFSPIDLHFTTHTARMFDDITDEAGKILLTRIYRLESLRPGIAEVLTEIGVQPSLKSEQAERQNVNTASKHFTPTKAQVLRIEKLYAADFDVYENAARK